MKKENCGMFYEGYLRKAFKNCDRGCDPARLADADVYTTAVSNNDYLNELKIGIGYAMIIKNHDCQDEVDNCIIDSDDLVNMNKLLADVLKADSVSGVLEAAEEHEKLIDNIKKRIN